MTRTVKAAAIVTMLGAAVAGCAMPPTQYARDGGELGRHVVTWAVTARVSVILRMGRLIAEVRVANHFWDQICLPPEKLAIVEDRLDPRVLSVDRVMGEVLELADPEAAVGFYEGHYEDPICFEPGDSITASLDLEDAYGPVFLEGQRYRVTYDAGGDSQTRPPAEDPRESYVGVFIASGMYVFEVPEGYRPSEP